MSLVLLSHTCSHLQNASLARLGLTSLPLTTQVHTILLQLQKHGYVNTVAIAGPVPPPPSALAPVMGLGGDDGGRKGHVAPGGDERFAPVEAGEEGTGMSAQRASNEGIVTRDNVSTRRIWVGLKYYNYRPVLESMRMVSKPTRRYWMGLKDLEGLCLGEKRGHIRGLRGVGETIFVTSDRGVMDVREAVRRRVGGMLLCRINGI